MQVIEVSLSKGVGARA